MGTTTGRVSSARALAPPPLARRTSGPTNGQQAPRSSAAQSALVFAGDSRGLHPPKGALARVRALPIGVLASAIGIPTWGLLAGVFGMTMSNAVIWAVIAGGFAATMIRGQ